MFFTSQLQQIKQLRANLNAERRADLKKFLVQLVQGVMCGLVLLAPAFTVAFGWVKD